ncbi:DUF4240 domain-containing protein [Niallia nealsonii]|uniref:Molybdenum metabolism regulator n=1 Tax=Niallia nealsonii TaxID=115979 RepID=A0A2N0Z2L1_9BACI|nr:DUF4240 domain-containing protein [Niallia nealsonii]PKG23745.1 molybdenum metabolism regulator [Niallia nealsonii]
MNKQQFWQLIEQSNKQEEPIEWLTETLAQKEVAEIVDLEYYFQTFQQESYQSRLWAAAYLLMDGCSDDTFDYFCGWLIIQGEETFHKVLESPEYLAAYITEENLGEEGYPQNEELLTAGFDACTLKKTGDIK